MSYWTNASCDPTLLSSDVMNLLNNQKRQTRNKTSCAPAMASSGTAQRANANTALALCALAGDEQSEQSLSTERNPVTHQNKMTSVTSVTLPWRFSVNRDSHRDSR